MNPQVLMKTFAIVLALALPNAAIAQDLIPSKRMVLQQDSDYAGGDIASIFDTTLDACQRACLTNTACEAFTFNTRNNSCFPKAGGYESAEFFGAISGRVVLAEAGVNDTARARRGELSFIYDWEFPYASEQAAGLAALHIAYGNTSDELTMAARDSEANGDLVLASEYQGSALNITDSAGDWAEYARLLLAAADSVGDQQRAYIERSQYAAMNAYLRASDPALQHSILVTLGQALERLERGPDTVKALRLALSLQPRDDTAQMLDSAAAQYGFRIIDTLVQSDLARPRICAVFSDTLDPKITDFTPYVSAPDAAITITSDGYTQICAEGLQHGQRYALTFREGLPAKDGQVLPASVDIMSYVRDRAPGVRFAGRGYVLPKGGDAALPVQTVNTEKLGLELYRVTDRNLMRALQNGFLSAPMAQYQEYDFTAQIGTKLWSGTADVTQDVNVDVTTRLPLTKALAGQTAGIYALRATVPGVDPYAVPSAWQWFVVSDIGLTTLSGVDGLHVFARSLGDASALSGADVQLVSEANEVLATAKADDQGYARFDAALTAGTGAAAPALIVARMSDADMAFLSLKDAEFDLSDRGVAGRPAAPPVDVFMATDRGAYRPGETVYVTALARDSAMAAVEGLPLTAVLSRPDGVEYSRAVVSDFGAGGHVFSLPVAGSAPRGQWKIEMFADTDAPALAQKTFLVEDFLPERIDFTLTLPDAPIRLGDVPQLTLDAQYLFGAPASDLAIEGEVGLSLATGLPDWQGYTFGRHDAAFSAGLETISGSRTDENGLAAIALAMPQIDNPNKPLQLEATVRIADGSARPVERKVTKILAPSAQMIGIKPLFDGAAPEGGEARFALIALDENGEPASRDLAWTATKVETDYQWYQNSGNWYWEPVTTRSKIAEGVVQTGASATEVAIPVTWGEFELALTAPDGTAASTLFSAGWYGGADTATTPDMLEMALDAPSYRAGDTAKLRMVARTDGVALVQVLSNRLIAMQAVAVKAGANTVDLPVTDDWGTGVYVTASALRGMDAAAGRNPARALGVAHASIDPAQRALTAIIETAAEATPRGPLDIAVKVDGVAAGETAYVTIAAVDLGILNLTAYTPPDPMDHYFGQRKLGVGIRDIYGRLIDGLNGAMGTVRSGGDAGANARLQGPPPTEELVAYFTGPVAVGEDGFARASFTLPAFNGTVKVMAIAWSKTAVGQASADVLVRDPVVVAASLPRFMALGDTSRLALNITHATGPTGQMALNVTATGAALGDVPASVDLGNKATARIEVPIVADALGNQTITVALTTPDGKTLQKTLTLPVQINDAPIVRTSRFDLAAGAEFTADSALFDGLLVGTAKATITAGPMARLNAAGIMQALDGYPYGCTEQITSKAMPLLYLSDLTTGLGISAPEDLPARINAALNAVLVTQNASGAFGLWQVGNGGDMWLDAYITDFLGRARARGFEVPDQAFRMALDNLRNQVNYFPDFDYGGEGLAYALMVLAREGAAAIGDLRYYADVKGDAFATPAAQAQLGAALASYGDQQRADAMFARAAAAVDALGTVEAEQIWRADYGTNLRDAAVVLALATEAKSQVVDTQKLLAAIAAPRALSTQEQVWTLLAAAAMNDAGTASDITVNGAPVSGPAIQLTDAMAAPVLIKNNGADTSLTITTIGIPMGPEAAGGAGYAITRSYFTLDGAPVDASTVSVGTRMAVILEVIPFGRGEARLMVNDPLPAGFEIDNPNLIGSALPALAGFDLLADTAHSEFRQDRFLSAVDRMDNLPFRLGYVVRAVSAGEFHHPAAVVEDMYRPDLSARTEAGRVLITP
jgi:uncharacterized protein YfaS (alpha-2-macroglobulin family)